MNVSTQNVAHEGALCIVPALIVHSTVAQMAGGGNPVRGGPVIPNEALSVGTFNARRLWYGDGSLHDGFRVLTHILSVWSVSVLCIQEVQAGESLRFQLTSLSTTDGPEGTFGREAAFLVRDGVRSVPVSGVDDTTSVRWRVFGGSWCICSFYAPHAGVPC